MLVSKNTKICVTPNANAKICVTPNANPQREQMEYRWRWVPNLRGWRWTCRFHVVYFLFPHIGYPMRTQFPVEYRLELCDMTSWLGKYPVNVRGAIGNMVVKSVNILKTVSITIEIQSVVKTEAYTVQTMKLG